MVTSLAAEANRNPLIRNAMYWHPDAGLKMPAPESGLSPEEAELVKRYDAFLSGRTPWERPGADRLRPAR